MPTRQPYIFRSPRRNIVPSICDSIFVRRFPIHAPLVEVPFPQSEITNLQSVICYSPRQTPSHIKPPRRHQTLRNSNSASNSRVAIPHQKPCVLRNSRPIIVTRSGDTFITENFLCPARRLSFIVHHLSFRCPLHWIASAASCPTTVKCHATKPYVFQPFRSPIATLTFRARRKNILRACPPSASLCIPSTWRARRPALTCHIVTPASINLLRLYPLRTISCRAKRATLQWRPAKR